jgi:hypothetical protein
MLLVATKYRKLKDNYEPTIRDTTFNITLIRQHKKHP